jgi:hypothetical protein
MNAPIPSSWTENAEEIDRLTKQRDELAEALRALSPMFDNDGPLLTVYADEIVAARAALAKVSA